MTRLGWIFILQAKEHRTFNQSVGDLGRGYTLPSPFSWLLLTSPTCHLLHTCRGQAEEHCQPCEGAAISSLPLSYTALESNALLWPTFFMTNPTDLSEIAPPLNICPDSALSVHPFNPRHTSGASTHVNHCVTCRISLSGQAFVLGLVREDNPDKQRPGTTQES